MAKIKIMTFNLRIRVESDGANYFDNRLSKIVGVIRDEAPDLIGFQEANGFMRKALADALPEYLILGHGRRADYTGEGTPIAFRKDRFDLHAFREEWLSLLPGMPESRLEGLDQSTCPRVYVAADLIHTETGSPVSFFNVHTDHKGKTAQIAECAQVMTEIGKTPFPFILTGDFNAHPDSDPIRLILATADTLGTVDATSEIPGSFHSFATPDAGDCKIDYVFTNCKTDPTESYKVPDDDSTGCYYSDHNALVAFAEIGENI